MVVDLQGCHKDAVPLFSGCSLVVPGCHKDAVLVVLWLSLVVTRMLSLAVLWLLPGCSLVVTVPIPQCFGLVTRM